MGYGQFVGMALSVADRLRDQGIGATVVDPLWALPISPDLVALATGFDVVLTLEDNLVEGGVGQRVSSRLAEAGSDARVLTFGIPQRFLEQGTREEVLDEVGLTAPKVALEALGAILAQPVRQPEPERQA